MKNNNLTNSDKKVSLDWIERRAEELRRDMGADSNRIDMVGLAKKLGFDVYEASFNEDIDGMVINSKKERSIYVNAEDIPQRKRFTIAHELGHVILHHNNEEEYEEVDYRGKNKFFDAKEWQANVFAAALLMPRGKVKEVWEGVNDIDELARVFDVSKLAASIRLQSLGLIR